MNYSNAVILAIAPIPIAIVYIMYLAYLCENLSEEIQELKDKIRFFIKKRIKRISGLYLRFKN